jgi:hypothetical protein
MAKENEDAREVWRGQAVEVLSRQRARELRARTWRREVGVWTAPFVVAALAVFAWRAFTPRALPSQILFGVAAIWSGVGVIALRDAGKSFAVDAAGIEYCKSELKRRIDFLERGLFWGFAPLLTGVVAFVAALWEAAGDDILKGLPFIMMTGVWVLAYFWMRYRETLALRRELEELERLSRTH